MESRKLHEQLKLAYHTSGKVANFWGTICVKPVYYNIVSICPSFLPAYLSEHMLRCSTQVLR